MKFKMPNRNPKNAIADVKKMCEAFYQHANPSTMKEIDIAVNDINMTWNATKQLNPGTNMLKDYVIQMTELWIKQGFPAQGMPMIWNKVGDEFLQTYVDGFIRVINPKK